ncbi:MAG: bifunctional UDP-N-acetylglucosamine diphosphorylase/glucosamine-1-phosphate N-acetyltransferase GlmU [Leptolyngbyaceae bacterium]|nr:bifunctional UDP-N-acetylglucosamine diphosphorylase/glucosamine-1-phosphate N-acetyltransferase GlmU [Leptolyngbyaceae bacterium]
MVAVVILAAGRGTRMKSALPKVLHPLGGRSLVEHAICSLANVEVDRILVVVGYQGEQVEASLRSHDGSVYNPDILQCVEQTEQLGTGHAVQQILPHLNDYDGDVLVLNGDVPLIRPETLERMLGIHRAHNNAATILTANLSDPTGYGRVFCNADTIVSQIVEHRDCTPAQLQNRRINAGVYCFRWADLSVALPQLKNDNDQQEFYLTDIISMVKPVMAVDVDDPQEILGVNNRQQLAVAYEIMQARIRAHWMAAGVTLINQESITIDDTVTIEPDVTIEPQTHLRGYSTVKTGSRIGPGSLIENSQIGSDATIEFSIVRDSEVGAHSRIGPYAHLRGHAQVGESCRIGNFVEIKKSVVGDRTNAAHLSYLGDATLGTQVNIGAGTITANYDGVNKHQTVIGDRSKTGSNSVLVAPLTLGTDVTVAAGSTVTEDVPDDSLVVARARQVVKSGWRLGGKVKE